MNNSETINMAENRMALMDIDMLSSHAIGFSMTNRQYLSSLNNEKLAKIIAEGQMPWCNDEGAPFSCEGNCQACIERWLEEDKKEEVKPIPDEYWVDDDFGQSEINEEETS